jgi:hypothetical protein
MAYGIESIKFKYIEGNKQSFIWIQICVSIGLSPLVRLLNMVDSEVTFDNRLGDHIPLHDEDIMTSKPKIYVATAHKIVS